MSCYGCGTGFSAFKKEHGCKNCGFAFCNKCLTKKLEVPKRNNERHHVCNKCYNILTGKVVPKEESGRYSPPENYKKRVAALEERESKGLAPVPVSKVGTSAKPKGTSGEQYRGMSKADIEIQQRLEKLREKTPQEAAAANVSHMEIDDRLAKLKGMDPTRYNTTSNKPTHHPPDRRTQQEQMNDLLDEISNEVQLDSHLPDPAQEIAVRLAQLKGTDVPQPPVIHTVENNLNKSSHSDSKSFASNISDKTKTSVSGEGPAGPGSEDMSPEEMRVILSEAARELERDAQRALQGLEEDKEIMKRLQETKQRRKESNTDVNKDEESESDNENEAKDDATAAAIVHQFLEESKLDEAAAKQGLNTGGVQPAVAKPSNISGRSGVNDEYYDPDELPYCCICTEDATVRCFGCDRDLYCSKCFSDGHKELGLTDHTSVKYIPPNVA